MAHSLHRKPNSPYWFAYIRVRDPDNPQRWKQTTKSTRETTKAKAELKARELEKAAQDAAGAGDDKSRAIYDILKRAGDAAVRGELNEAAARVFLSDLLKASTGKGLNHYTVREWFGKWLGDKKKANAAGTFIRYQGVINQFLTFLAPERADGSLLALTADDITEFRDAEHASGKSASTVNDAVKTIRTSLNQAKRAQVLLSNPADAVGMIAEDDIEKAVFTPADLLRLLSVAENDWKGVILFGYYTGANLRDITDLQWSQIDPAGGRITYTRQKTSRKVELPIHPELGDWILSLPSGDDPRAYVFPDLAGKSTAGKSGLSMKFGRLMAKAGIQGESIEATPAEDGSASKGRIRNTLSFHSLRHSFNSALANAGVPVEIRQKFTGHASAAMNANYTHLEMETFRKAIANVPGIGN